MLADRDALADRLFKSTIGALELYHVYLGERLGLYTALAAKGPLTSHGLASEVGINERYAREWLEQQAVAGVLTVELDAQGDRGYSLPRGHAEVLVDADSVNFLAPLGRAMVGIGGVMPAVVEAFRVGGGVPYEAYGADMRGAIATLNRPAFLTLLGADWFPSIPELDQRLRSQPAARIADLGCGTGWSSIAMALAYPLVRVDGIDLDLFSVEEARHNAVAAGVGGRVTFEVRDASDPKLAGSYDLVTAFETIHDMSRPVEALRAMRSLVRPGAYVVVMDEKTADEFTAPGDELQRFLYGWSAVHCLAASMVDPASAATGTVMRPERLRQYALEAGFAGIDVLPIEHDSWRFYRLIDTARKEESS